MGSRRRHARPSRASSPLALFTLLLMGAHAAAGAETPATPEEPAKTAEEQQKPLRIAVYELELSGVPEHWGKVVLGSLLAELRKLDRVSVIGMDEIRAMLGHEAQKQLVGCSQESCLSEIADALGVDVLVIGSLARVSDEHIFGLRRLDQLSAQVTGGVNRRFKAGNGEEFLVAIGPAVEELFPERPLRPGMERGVPEALSVRLNPPPLPAWSFYSVAAVSSTLLLAGLGAGAWNLVAQQDLASYKASADPFVTGVFHDKVFVTDATGYATYALLGAALLAGVVTGVSFFFTDFTDSEELR